MTEKSYQDAVQVLKSRLGGRWDGLEAEGRDEMVRILKDELGYDDRQAKDAIDAMVETGSLRYHRGIDADGPVAAPPVPVATGTVATGAPASGGPPVMPLATGAVAAGYWQIGPGMVESTGRKGQVTPS